MMFHSLAVVATALTGLAAAQEAMGRPMNTSICDYYTTALLMNNTAANQMTLLTLVVNTAVIGNYTKPNVGITVPGILAPGEFNGTAVDLAPYFNGALASTNAGGSSGVSKNFLDGGGAKPLMDNKPADDNTSMQYILLTHLYSYFGGLLGCTHMGADFPVYTGSNSMYKVHKFMDLSAAEVGYFINQVAMSAASFGVADADLAVVGKALNGLFGSKCSAEAVVQASQPAGLQAICVGEGCPTAVNATCAAYGTDALVEPSTAVASLIPTSTPAVTGTGTAAATPTGTSAPTTSPSTAAAAPTGVVGGVLAAAAVGVAAMLL